MYGIHLWKDSIIIMYEYIYIYYSAVFLLLGVPFLSVGMMHVNDKQMVRRLLLIGHGPYPPSLT